MKRLGEILLARGALSKDQLQSALSACKRNGGRLGTWTVRLGYVGESVLLAALSEQSGCPSVTALELASIPAEVRSLLPTSFAKRHLVVPFARRGRNLDVAMASPHNLVLVDEIASLTAHVVRAYVATEAALAAALAIPVSSVARVGSGPPPGPPPGSAREWRQFWRLDSTTRELARALDGASRPACRPHSASFPSLEELGVESPTELDTGLSNLAAVLRTVNRRDDVARHVLAILAKFAPRVALFSLHKGKVMGWAARGQGIIEEDFHTLMLPVDRPSVLLNLNKGADVHVGPIGTMAGNVILEQALGTPKPTQAVVLSIRVRGKTVAFAWLDDGENDVSGMPMATIREVARLAGLALEVIVLRQKIKTATGLTERPQPH